MGFDEVINRVGTGSIKWDGYAERFDLPAEGMLPLWVADMDFRAPQPVLDAIKRKAEYGILGYTEGFSEYYEAVSAWMSLRHKWTVNREWLVFGTTVVSALNRIVRTFTQPGDKVVVQPPVYPPFFATVKEHGREVVENPLKFDGQKYQMDFEDLEQKLAAGVKLLILCNPHNPVGRVWTREELQRLGELCLKYHVLMVSDEVHSDIVFKPASHTVLAAVSEEIAQNCIVLTSPHKTFNLAGLQISNAIIVNEAIRNTYKHALELEGIHRPNLFGIIGLIAAYQHGAEWLDNLLEYLEGNRNYLVSFLETKLPQIKLSKPEATFLVWLDMRSLGLGHLELEKLISRQAKLVLNQGYTFGEQGKGFVRLNLACPRATLAEALERLAQTINSL